VASFEALDADKDGKISKDEYLVMRVKRAPAPAKGN
jgi:Ca2+-binding EF-hand superfamily protein